MDMNHVNFIVLINRYMALIYANGLENLSGKSAI